MVDALADHTARLLGADAASAPPPPPPSRGAPPPPPPPGPWRAREVMHMVANASCLASAMQALDEWTLLQVWGYAGVCGGAWGCMPCFGALQLRLTF